MMGRFRAPQQIHGWPLVHTQQYTLSSSAFPESKSGTSHCCDLFSFFPSSCMSILCVSICGFYDLSSSLIA